YPLHRWVPWIAGFSAEFVDDCLCRHLGRIRRKEIWILDPFAGVGTTLVQGFLHRYNVVGFEINPYAALASRLKLKARGIPIDGPPVLHVVDGKLRLMLEDIIWLKERMRGLSPTPKSWIIPESFFRARGMLERKNFVDLVVTSPPYLNNYHYPRNTRPQLHWLGFASGPGYNGAGEVESFGKFWQTVRDSLGIGLSFRYPELEQIIERIRNLNAEKRHYGGPGWA